MNEKNILVKINLQSFGRKNKRWNSCCNNSKGNNNYRTNNNNSKNSNKVMSFISNFFLMSGKSVKKDYILLGKRLHRV